ncbi:MAG TPA: ABC transporter permease subunit [Hymenobacter sp.]|uniref:ABC transporter permease subunit n=1 Tax=Hymenobacter sp. TaxID=1898978 RepID=UPI002D7FEF26|nr:ABC transporter permease subunit [Hymenobacter sp.]HET9505600.1 ABC transporter permease subunit [Hymenobacter sp.]
MSLPRISRFAEWPWLAAGWLALLAAAGLLAPVLPLPFAPGVPDLLHVAEPPSWSAHWLGTDLLGRDVATEVLFGARQVVMLSLPAAVLAALAGALAGGSAGYWGNRGCRLPLSAGLLGVAFAWWLGALPGGRAFAGLLLGVAALAWRLGPRWPWLGRLAWPLPLDSLLQGAITLLGAVPRLLLVLVLAAGPALSASQLLLLLAAVTWPEPARQVRAHMLQVRALPFVEAARAAGLSPARVWLRHALPHACRPLRATVPLSVAGLVGLETTLAFLGVGRPPDISSWGQLLGMLRQEPGAWWLLAAAGGGLLLTLLALQRLARSGR